jgi:CRP-like cAMP-binding protein
MTNARTRLTDPVARADAIGRAAPFSDWPRAALIRLALASGVFSHRSETCLIVDGQHLDHITVVAEGSVISGVSSSGGRRVIFKFDDSHYAYGLTSFVDGLTVPHDLVAAGQVTVIRIPHAAIRAELSRLPSLWESIALEATRRGRGFNRQMQQFVFDAPRVRAASLLLGMLGKSGQLGDDGPVTIDLRLSQERLAELLGISRQWATALVRELSQAGLVEWRYGRVTVLDVPALRKLAAGGIDVMGQRNVPLTPLRGVDRAPTPESSVLSAGF